MRAEKIFHDPVTCSLVNVRAKRSQDNKPFRVMEEACPDRFSRGCPLEPAVASQSLEDGSISSLAVAFEATSAPLIPAQPFGLRLRFDEAHLVTHSRSRAKRVKPNHETGRSLAHSETSINQLMDSGR